MSKLNQRPINTDFLTTEELAMYNKPVLATSNGTDWFKGILVEVIDLFVPYGVKDEHGEIKYFADIKLDNKGE